MKISEIIKHGIITEAASSSAMINVTKFNLETLLHCYDNSGYDLSSSEKDSFKASKYFKYQNKSHVFWILCEDDNQSDEDGNPQWYITTLHVSLDQSGLLVAEPSGRPDFEGTKDEMKSKFESL